MEIKHLFFILVLIKLRKDFQMRRLEEIGKKRRIKEKKSMKGKTSLGSHHFLEIYTRISGLYGARIIFYLLTRIPKSFLRNSTYFDYFYISCSTVAKTKLVFVGR